MGLNVFRISCYLAILSSNLFYFHLLQAPNPSISLPGNGIAALHSVPTAIFCVLYCLQPRESLPENYGGLERTIAYSLALGGDTDTIACMAGAIAGAHYGIEAIPPSWIRCCEGAEDADVNAERLHMFYHQSSQGERSETERQRNGTEKKTGAE